MREIRLSGSTSGKWNRLTPRHFSTLPVFELAPSGLPHWYLHNSQHAPIDDEIQAGLSA